MLQLDHLAITCATLAEGIAFAEGLFGVPLSPGGEHPHMGTHNRLLSLGPGEYLEVIAINPDAPAPPYRRWFGLDDAPARPRLGAWIARVADLDTVLAQAPAGAGQAVNLARADLRWRMGVAPSGVTPFDGLFPALIEWLGKAHPAPRLPDQGIRLTALHLVHPDAEALRAALACDDPRLRITQGPVRLGAQFGTPRGEVTL